MKQKKLLFWKFFEESPQKVQLGEARNGLETYLSFCEQHSIHIDDNIIQALKASLEQIGSDDEGVSYLYLTKILQSEST